MKWIYQETRFIFRIGVRWAPLMVVPIICHCGGDLAASTTDGGGDASIADAAKDSAVSDNPCLNRPEAFVQPCLGCPGERPGGNCYLPIPDGGIYGRCREDGEEIGGKILGAYCCNHTDAGSFIGHIITPKIVTDAGTCYANMPIDLLLCSMCGDGVCSPWENRCSCPADCAL